MSLVLGDDDEVLGDDGEVIVLLLSVVIGVTPVPLDEDVGLAEVAFREGVLSFEPIFPTVPPTAPPTTAPITTMTITKMVILPLRVRQKD